MVFSDTTNKNGIIQRCEQWTGLGDAVISGDTTLIKIFTAAVNEAFDELMPLILSYSAKGRWDDTNNTDFPIGKFDLVSGQNDYSVKTDGSVLRILRVFDVQFLASATATDYTTLTKMTLEDDRALHAMAPTSADTGIPTHWLERDNVIFLYPKPNYSATNGVKIFYEREQSRFVSTDTTKEPGIPVPFHNLLVYITAHAWLIVNKQANTVLISRLETKITAGKGHLSDLISARNPQQSKMTASAESNK